MAVSRSARAGLHSLGGTGTQMVIQLVSLTVLARFLEPAEFGVYGMAITFIGFTTLFRDLGLSSAAIQVKSLPIQLRTNLWWINTGTGAILALLTLATAPLIAAFYREPQVAFVVAFMAPTMLLAGAAVQYRASLARDLRLGAAAAIDVTGALLGLIVSVGVALAGGGVWALVLPQLVSGVVTLAGVIFVSRWLPGLPRRGHGTRQLVRFGGAMFVSQALTYTHRTYDVLLLGRLHGADWTGQFNRAAQMSRMPMGMIAAPFSKVALATMAPHQEDVHALGALARRGQVLLALPVLLAAGGLVAAAEPLVSLVLGDGWGQAVPFLQLIAMSEALALMASVGGWLMAARGQGSKLIRLGVISTVIKVSTVSLGSLWGPYGIVPGVVVAQVILWPLSLVLTGRMSGVSTREALVDSYVLVGVTASATAAGWYAGRTHIVPGGPAVDIVAVVVTMLATLALAAALVAPFRRDVQTFLQTVRSGVG